MTGVTVAEDGRHDAAQPVAEQPVRRLRDASKPFLWGLAGIALLGLLVRVYFVLVGYDYYKVGGDAVFYHYEAWMLADGRGFIDPLRWMHFHQVAQAATHPPLYAMYLAVVSRLGFWSVTDHRLASTLLGTAAVVVIGITGWKFAGERVGLIAAFIAALYANLWINDGMLLSESMSALTLCIVLLATYCVWQRPTLKNAVWFGLALGLAILSRAEVALLAPFLAIPMLLYLRTVSVRRRVELLAVAAGMAVLLVGPWVGYNLNRFNKPVYITDSVGSVLSSASCDPTYYGKYLGWYAPCYAFKSGPIPGDASERDDVVRKQAVQYIKDHKGRVPIVVAARVGRLWDVWKPKQNVFLNGVLEGRTLGASQLALGSYYFLMPLAIAGVIVMRRRRIPISPIVAPAIVVTIAAAMFFGTLRYRVSAEPAIVLAAAVSVDVLWTSMIDRRRAARRAETTPMAPT